DQRNPRLPWSVQIAFLARAIPALLTSQTSCSSRYNVITLVRVAVWRSRARRMGEHDERKQGLEPGAFWRAADGNDRTEPGSGNFISDALGARHGRAARRGDRQI